MPGFVRTLDECSQKAYFNKLLFCETDVCAKKCIIHAVKISDWYICNKCLAVAEMGDRLATIDMDRLLCPFLVMSPHLTQCGLSRDLSPYQVAS